MGDIEENLQERNVSRERSDCHLRLLVIPTDNRAPGAEGEGYDKRFTHEYNSNCRNPVHRQTRHLMIRRPISLPLTAAGLTRRWFLGIRYEVIQCR